MKWTDDLPAEQRISEFGASFKIETLDVDSIDWEKSRANSARLSEPIDDDLVLEYATAMERGDIFPRIVVIKHGHKATICSGNHRAKAALLRDENTIDAYVVETTDEAIADLLPRVLNRVHGKRQSREEAMLHALHAVAKYSYPPKKAAKVFGLPDGSVATELRIQEARRFFQSKAIKTDSMPKAVLSALQAIENENVKAAVGRLISQKKLTSDQSQEFISDVRKNKTEATQMAAVAKVEQQTEGMDPGPAVKIPRNVRTKFIGWLTTGENYLERTTRLSQLQITSTEETQRIKGRLQSLVRKIETLLNNRRKEAS